jgi:branched-chain amino acid transport system permease protein
MTALRLTSLRALAWPAVWLAAMVVLAGGPSFLSRGQLDEAVTVFGLIAIAQAWNIVAGFGGQVSLGVGAFVGTGAYAATLLMLKRGTDLLPSMLLATVLGALVALIVSPALFRLRGPYFTVGSLGLALAIAAWMENWSYSDGTQPITVPFEQVPLPETLYRYALGIAALAMLAAWVVRRSKFGLRLMAVRDDERAASTLGVSAFRVKVTAFVLSGAITALAGALVAVQTTSIEPVSAFGLTWTINAIVMTVVGGIGTLVGPVLGVLVVFYAIQQPLQDSAEISQLVTGLLLIVAVRFAPHGLWILAVHAAKRIGAITATSGGKAPPRRKVAT